MDTPPLPSDLPVPVDDGAADHLSGKSLPTTALVATDGTTVNLAAATGRWVIYVYPRTGQPGVASPTGWNAIPGARGCTPQSCSYRDHHRDFQALATRVYGLSTQTTEYQREAKARLRLPFELLSDTTLTLHTSLELPTFGVDGLTLYRRLTLVGCDDRIEAVFYPVFPPDADAAQVLAWLQTHPPQDHG